MEQGWIACRLSRSWSIEQIIARIWTRLTSDARRNETCVKAIRGRQRRRYFTIRIKVRLACRTLLMHVSTLIRRSSLTGPSKLLPNPNKFPRQSVARKKRRIDARRRKKSSVCKNLIYLSSRAVFCFKTCMKIGRENVSLRVSWQPIIGNGTVRLCAWHLSNTNLCFRREPLSNFVLEWAWNNIDSSVDRQHLTDDEGRKEDFRHSVMLSGLERQERLIYIMKWQAHMDGCVWAFKKKVLIMQGVPTTEIREQQRNLVWIPCSFFVEEFFCCCCCCCWLFD